MCWKTAGNYSNRVPVLRMHYLDLPGACRGAHKHTHRHPTRSTHTTTLPPVQLDPTPHVSSALPAAYKHRSRSPAVTPPRAKRATRWAAGRHSPTKPMLPTASIDANQAANAPDLGAGSMPAAPRLAVLRRPAPAPPSPPSRPRKRRENPPSRAVRHHRLRPPT